MMLLLSIVRVAGTCEGDDGYFYSANQIEIQRCSDEKYFYYTSRFENETFCPQLDSSNPGICWWDTSVESHCLDSEECVWLNDNIPGGACYCSVSTDCEDCSGKTPGPTFSSTAFECPDDCKVYYVGCVGMYCNCFGECADPVDLGCANPVNPGCHTWITTSQSEVPTLSPTPAKAVYWGCKLCCFTENLLEDTTSAIAQALGLFNHQVKISRFAQFFGRRRSEADPAWEIIYEIGLEASDSTEALMTSLENAEVLNSIKVSMNAALGIELQNIETTSLSENQPTDASSKSDSMGATIGGIIGGIAGVLLLCFVCYRFYIIKKLGKHKRTATIL